MSDRWLTIPQAVARLAESGITRSPDTIRWWIRQGWLTAHQPPHSRTRYIRETDLLACERDRHLAEQRVRLTA